MCCSRLYCVLFYVTLIAVFYGAVANTTASELQQMDLFVAGEGGYHTYRIPAVAVMPEGTILVFAEGRKSSSSDSGDIDLLMRRSCNDGRSWSKMKLVYEEGGDKPITIGNPAPVVDRDTDKLFLFFTRNNRALFLVTSSDNGQTFTFPQNLTEVAKQFDFKWTRLGAGPTSGIQTSKGRLIVPVWLNRKIGDPDMYRAGVIYSDDHGKTWAAGKVAPVNTAMRGMNESDVIELADGKIYMTQRTNAGRPARSKSVSADGGETWTEGLFAPEINPRMTTIKASLARYSTAKKDGKNPLLYAATDGSGRSHMTVWLSEDEAKTWPISKRIYPGPAGYAELAITKDKTILLFYEGDKKFYANKIRLARFKLEWLTDPSL